MGWQMQATIFRIASKNAGRLVAFDRIYVFRREEEILFPRIFPYCFVTPVIDSFVERIEKAIPRTTKVETFSYRRERGGAITPSPTRDDVLTAIELNTAEYRMLVPMLYTRFRRAPYWRRGQQNNALARYVASKIKIHITRKEQCRSRLNKGAFVSLKHKELMRACGAFEGAAYLLVNGVKAQPVCALCPNSLEEIHGTCYYGSPECAEHLISPDSPWNAGIVEFTSKLDKENEIEEFETEGAEDGVPGE